MSSLMTIPDALLADYRSEAPDTPLDDASAWLESLWQPAFPSAELVDQAAALLPHLTRVRHATEDEGPHTFITIGPGMISVRAKDFARAERTYERELHRRQVDAELASAHLLREGKLPDKPDPTRVISQFSRRSRSRMTEYLGMLDFGPMFTDRTRRPAMVTLTYPGDWLTVVPSGQELKAQMKKLRKRYERAWGETLYCVWKLEFQFRGAPHVHMLMVPPHGTVGGLKFREWLSVTWAAVVAHPDPTEYVKHLGAGTNVDHAEGLRNNDPKRVAVYFTKHGLFRDKEYQHIVPEEWQQPGCTPGRFWGYWGLEKRTAVVETTHEVATLAGRTLRRWSAAQGVTRETTAPRYRGGRADSAYPEVIGLAGKLLMLAHSEVSYRKVRRPARRMKANRGFVMVNSGPEMASQLARYLDQAVSQ